MTALHRLHAGLIAYRGHRLRRSGHLTGDVVGHRSGQPHLRVP
jgi:hypothetical protein